MMTSLVLCICTFRSGTSKQTEHFQIPHFKKKNKWKDIVFYHKIQISIFKQHDATSIQMTSEHSNFTGQNNFSMMNGLQNPICIGLLTAKLTAEVKTLPCARTASHYQKRMHNKHFHFM